MDRRKFWRTLTRVHKWAGLVLGIQIILWFASGLFMSFFDIDNVRGDNIAEAHTWPLRMEQTAPFSDAHTLYLRDQKTIHCKPMQRNACVISPLKSINLLSALGTPVWEFDNGKTKIYYAGKPAKYWTGLDEDKIRGVARSYYKGDAKISKAVLFTEIVPKDFRKDIPIWQVSFDDKSNTRLYIAPVDGKLINVRTRLWRTFDFMWMLHIMDYKERDNFNLWWLKLAAFAGLLFALSGVALVTHRVFLRPKKIKMK
ncbi:MAG: PepSY domain-containing protein [Robiginitomaculum sp.]|nr:PepSY domain-containing protein [Robiginitomaculum sp.]